MMMPLSPSVTATFPTHGMAPTMGMGMPPMGMGMRMGLGMGMPHGGMGMPPLGLGMGMGMPMGGMTYGAPSMSYAAPTYAAPTTYSAPVTTAPDGYERPELGRCPGDDRRSGVLGSGPE